VELSWLTLLALFGVALVASIIDAIAGGGGLLTLPALFTAGLPAHIAVGTNKGSSVWGSGAALFRFWRSGMINRRTAPVLFLMGLTGSFGGAALVMLVQPAALKPVVLVLLLAAGIAVGFLRPPADASTRPLPAHALLKGALIAGVIGCYDGFFGPGTGTFLIICFVAFLHLTLPDATANAKVVNFASNLAAVILFSLKGVVRWEVSLCMAVGQLTGGTLGAHLAIKGGHKLIRAVVLLVVLALVVRLGYDLLHTP